MNIKRTIVIIEALIVVLLSSIIGVNKVEAVNHTLMSDVPVISVETTKYDPSISQRVFHIETAYNDINQQGWIIQKAYLYSKPYPGFETTVQIIKYDTIKITGENEFEFYRVEYNGKTYYCNKSAVTTSKEVYQSVVDATYNPNWRYRALTPSRGTIQGPSGKETYYNLDMSYIVVIMRRYGNYDKYWVRDDGVKMLGDYVMVAASLDIRPRGSLIETSLGMGIVVDTGGFALRNKTQLDIAVEW